MGELLIASKSLEDVRTFRIDIVAEEGRIDTWIGREFLLVETLYGLQGLFGRHTELTVAVDLQGRQVVQAWRRFRTFLGRHVCDGERQSANLLKVFQDFFLRGELAFGGLERCIAIDG